MVKPLVDIFILLPICLVQVILEEPLSGHKTFSRASDCNKVEREHKKAHKAKEFKGSEGTALSRYVDKHGTCIDVMNNVLQISWLAESVKL